MRALVFVVYLLLVGTLILCVKPGHAPDEAAHVDYVKFIVQQQTLPVFRGAAPPQAGYEFHQPPLYYLACAPGATVFSGDALFLWCRTISALFGLGTLFCIGQAARILWPEKESIATTAGLVAAVWPFHLSVSASAGNDSAAGFFCAALFYLIARGVGQGWSARDALLAGLCAGLGVWAKTTTLPVSLAALGAAWELQRYGRAARWKGLPAPLTLVLVASVVAMPLFMRNQSLYGDPLGWQAFSQAATSGTPGYPQFSQAGFDFITYAYGILLILFCTFWGFFGGPDAASRALRPLNPKPFPVDLLPFALVCVLATIVAFSGLLLLRRRDEWQEDSPLLLRWWLLGVAWVFLGWAQFAYNHFSGGQARYLHPALLPFCVLGVISWRTVFKGAFRVITGAIFLLTLLGLTLMNLFVWQTLV